MVANRKSMDKILKNELIADVYCRVSTQKETQHDSIVNQQEKGKMVAEELGAQINNIYIDDGKSGTKVKGRTSYQRMMDDIRNRRVQLIITKDVDRLNRNLLEFCKFLDLVVQNDVKVYFYLTNEYYDITQDTVIKIRAVLAEDYSKNLSVKAHDAHDYRQSTGKSVIFTNKTWGYKTVYLPDGSKQLIIDNDEAEMIKIIFNLCIQGFGVHRIAKKLFSMGYRNHNGNMINKGVILAILKNPKVMGTAIYNKRRYDFGKKKMIRNSEDEWIIKENVVPAIISEETFLLANSMLKERTIKIETNYDEEKVQGYFQGCCKLSRKLICGDCGAYYTRQVRKLVSGERVYDWICMRYRDYGRKTVNPYKVKNCNADVRLSEDGCDNSAVKQEVVYNVLKKIRDDYFGVDAKIIDDTIKILEKSLKEANENGKDQAELRRAESEIEAVNDKIAGLAEKLLSNTISDDTYKLLVGRFEKERACLMEKLNKLNEKQLESFSIENRIKQMREEVKTKGFEEVAIETVLEYIDKIYVFNDRFEVCFKQDEMLMEKIQAERIVYPFRRDEMKYRRNDMDKTNEILYNAIKANDKILIQELSEISGLSRTTVHFRIKRFKELGYLRHKKEPGKKKEWEILREWDSSDAKRLTMREEN